MRIAIITGASAGLGQAFFAAVRRRCAGLDQIWLIARRADRLAEMAADCPIPTVAVPLDLASADAYQALADKLAAEQPTVELLINNAGLGALGNMADSDIPTQIQMVDVNCRGLTAVTTAVLPYMTKGGTIINVASIAAFAPNARMAVYSSTKAFVLSLSGALREELRDSGINVLAVCPGPMSTEFLDIAAITGHSKTFERLPYCDPQQVANRALDAALSGKAVYTNRLFFKFYRLLAKLLPRNLVMKLCKT